MDITIVKKVDNKEFIELYKAAGWWKEEYAGNTSFINQIVTGSFLFVAAFDTDGKMIGMGRAISDGCSDAYIQDVVVLKEFRRQGIGGKITAFLTNELIKRGIDWIGLVGEPGTEKFYSALGFERLDSHIPMKWIDK